MNQLAITARPRVGNIQVPFFRADLLEPEINEVVGVLRSGWLTTGAMVHNFEESFAAATGARWAVAVNSCTAALHLAVEALGLRAGEAVLVPSMTFAATAEVVRYCGAIPILVDCDPVTTNMDLGDAERKLAQLASGGLGCIAPGTRPVGIIPVHVGGLMMDIGSVREFANRNGLWVIEDAAHALPAAWRPTADSPWQRCGQKTSAISCFSFYANKTITTGEGGMATTDNAQLADRMRLMSLHGLSQDAWTRYSGGKNWDYKIVAPGFKYNLTDIAAAIGVHQLARAEQMRRARERIAHVYLQRLVGLDQIEVPPSDTNRIHSWHLFPLKLCLKRLSIRRDDFVAQLKAAGIGCAVHWRPLHLHPYYRETFGWREEHCPMATLTWQRLVSLPIFPSMTNSELNQVISTITELCHLHAK